MMIIERRNRKFLTFALTEMCCAGNNYWKMRKGIKLPA